MLQRKLGASGIDASVVGLGTWAIGGWMWGGADEPDAVEAVQAAVDHGVNLIDTAPMYGFGRSEEIVGKAIAGRRDKVVLATKCGLRWDLEKGQFFFHTDENHPTQGPSKVKVHRYLGPESIRQELERSLKRLGTDCIDLYQTHWQDGTTPVEDTMAELLKQKDAGKIRAIGVSNCDLDQLRAYGAIDSDQERFSMLDRHIEEKGTLAHCRENHVAVLAYSPLEQGLLTGKVAPLREFAEGDQRRNNPSFSVANRRRIGTMLAGLEPVADAHSLTMAQLVIAWTFHQDGVTHVLCGARRPKQAVENAAAGDVNLTAEELAKMDEVVRAHQAE